MRTVRRSVLSASIKEKDSGIPGLQLFLDRCVLTSLLVLRSPSELDGHSPVCAIPSKIKEGCVSGRDDVFHKACDNNEFQ